MSCKGRLCDKFILSQAVTFADGTLTINLPAGAYANGCRYCLVIAQAIPDTTTVVAPVVITVGDGTAEYPLTNRCCDQVAARNIRTRTRYPVVVSTSAAGGVFKMLGNPCAAPEDEPAALDGSVSAGGDGA